MAGDNTRVFTDANFDQEVLKSDKPVLVDFWAEWCGPCRMMSPTVEAIAAEYGERAKVGKLNVDEAPEVAVQFGVNSIPRVLFFKGGNKPLREFTGVASEQVLANAPRWRALDAAAAALEALTFGRDAAALERVIGDLADVRAVGPNMAAIYDRADGRARALRGDPEGVALLRSVVERFDAQSAIFEAARTRELLADAVPGEARTLLETALAVYRQLRATPHLTRAEVRLVAL